MTVFLRSNSGRLAMLASCILGLALAQLPANAESTKAQPLADSAAKTLPVTSKIDRVQTNDGPRFVLNLTNTSKAALKVTAVVQVSVAVHNADKIRKLPEHAIEAGQTWSIPDLVALDKVTVNADGFAPLEVVIQ